MMVREGELNPKESYHEAHAGGGLPYRSEVGRGAKQKDHHGAIKVLNSLQVVFPFSTIVLPVVSLTDDGKVGRTVHIRSLNSAF